LRRECARRPDKAVYRHAELDRILNPRSIAIIGASSKPGSFGERVLSNLAGYAGAIHLVNAKYERLGEHRCYPSLSSLPHAPDCVVITIPREAEEDVVREAAAVGAGSVICSRRGTRKPNCPPDRPTGAPERHCTPVGLVSARIAVANYVRGVLRSATRAPANFSIRQWASQVSQGHCRSLWLRPSNAAHR
jgi:predicted CoA-binding protein